MRLEPDLTRSHAVRLCRGGVTIGPRKHFPALDKLEAFGGCRTRSVYKPVADEIEA